MIKYSETNPGDILKLVPPGASGFALVGDLLKVNKVSVNGCFVENRDGEECEFVYDCGAARLEPTEWKNDFPQLAEATIDKVEV